MLWKLLKYDFRAMFKQFTLIWPAALILGLVNRFTLPNTFFGNGNGASDSILTFITAMAFFCVLFGMFVVSLIFIIQRFHKGLLGDEGYLMHTLPVHTWQLVAAKLICAIFVTFCNTVVAILSVILLLPYNLLEIFRYEVLQAIIEGLIAHPDSILFVFEFLLFCLVALAMSLTMLYLAMAIGHLFQRRRVLLSIVSYFLINATFSWLVEQADRLNLFSFLPNFNNHLSILGATALMLVPTCLFFAGTSYILAHKLNLE